MEVLTLSIDVTLAQEVKSPKGTKVMVLFGGSCSGSGFSGAILPGGVDTQTITPDGVFSLSARYMVAGCMADGTPARLFVENNSLPDGSTRPVILTDCDALRFLEEQPLRGMVDNADGKLTIRIFDGE